MGEKIKKFSKYFGGVYMKYWYIAFAITVLLMTAFYISEKSISKYTFTVYNEDGSVASVEEISQEETQIKARSYHSRSVVPEKMF